jgi:hypothetical protein
LLRKRNKENGREESFEGLERVGKLDDMDFIIKGNFDAEIFVKVLH